MFSLIIKDALVLDNDENDFDNFQDQNSRGGMNRPGAIYGNDSKDSAVNCMPETQCYYDCKPPGKVTMFT